MARICKIVIVCEGWEDSSFLRGFLSEAGVDDRNVTPVVNPGGSGHDFVKRQFIDELKNLARYKEGRGVLGLIDEDGTGNSRKNAISAALIDQVLPPIADDEGRCLILSKRNIETWAYWLKANSENQTVILDEETDYKKSPPPGISRLEKKDFRLAGEQLHSLNHTQLPVGCPPSLGVALKQLRDFLNAIRR